MFSRCSASLILALRADGLRHLWVHSIIGRLSCPPPNYPQSNPSPPLRFDSFAGGVRIVLGHHPAHVVDGTGGPRVFGGDAVGAGVRPYRFPNHDACGQHEDYVRAKGERARVTMLFCCCCCQQLSRGKVFVLSARIRRWRLFFGKI